MRSRLASLALCILPFVPACTHYDYAKDVKMIAFDHDLSPGRGVGPVRGESCQESFLGIPTSEEPTLQQAVADAQAQHRLRYMNDIATDHTDLEVIFFARRCIVVTGTGFQ